ncbi:MAG: MarR family transcriptional regulator [Nocardioides sp.]|uniref:MarR family winged helix-turn-helix transcriptional regulator n=1 Tax=Nocardioides sp. TaxID=35761 RepID=UPI0039E46364
MAADPCSDRESSPPPAADWLSDEEMRTWLDLGAVIMWLPAALDAQLKQDAGLSHFEYQVLAMLSQSPDRTARMGDIAVLANGSPSRLTHAIARLEGRGWVTRTPGAGRSVLAGLTPSGWDKVVATAPGHVEAVRRYVFDTLTPAQVTGLGVAVARIREALRDPDDYPDGCPRP